MVSDVKVMAPIHRWSPKQTSELTELSKVLHDLELKKILNPDLLKPETYTAWGESTFAIDVQQINFHRLVSFLQKSRFLNLSCTSPLDAFVLGATDLIDYAGDDIVDNEMPQAPVKFKRNLFHLIAWRDDAPRMLKMLSKITKGKLDSSYLTCPDEAGATPLHYLALAGSVELIKEILKRKLIPEKTLSILRDGKGRNVLHYAVLSNDKNTVGLFAGLGVKLCRDKSAKSPIEYAVLADKQDLINALKTIPYDDSDEEALASDVVTPSMLFPEVEHFEAHSLMVASTMTNHSTSPDKLKLANRFKQESADQQYQNHQIATEESVNSPNSSTISEELEVQGSQVQTETGEIRWSERQKEWIEKIKQQFVIIDDVFNPENYNKFGVNSYQDMDFSRVATLLRQSKILGLAAHNLDDVFILTSSSDQRMHNYIRHLITSILSIPLSERKRQGFYPPELKRNIVHQLAWRGDLASIRKLYELILRGELHVDYLKKKDDRGLTPFHYAALSGNYQLVKFFCESNLLNKEFLTQIVDKYGRTALHYAALSGNFDTVNFLVQRLNMSATKRDFNGALAWHYAAMSGNPETLDNLIKETYDDERNLYDNAGRNLLHYAALGGHPNMVAHVEKHYGHLFKVDNNGRTPLYDAVMSGNIEILEHFIPQDVPRLITPQELLDRDKRNKNLMERDYQGFSLLDEAAKDGNLLMLRYLSDERGLNIRSKSKKGSALDHAIRAGSLPCLKYLVGEKGVTSISSETRKRYVFSYNLAMGCYFPKHEEYAKAGWVVSSNCLSYLNNYWSPTTGKHSEEKEAVILYHILKDKKRTQIDQKVFERAKSLKHHLLAYIMWTYKAQKNSNEKVKFLSQMIAGDEFDAPANAISAVLHAHRGVKGLFGTRYSTKSVEMIKAQINEISSLIEPLLRPANPGS